MNTDGRKFSGARGIDSPAGSQACLPAWLPACPFLPVPAREMDWRDLGAFRLGRTEGGGRGAWAGRPCDSIHVGGAVVPSDQAVCSAAAVRGGAFYETALAYAQFLWMRGCAARAVLCLDRAFGADLRGGEGVLRVWPLPYAALGWILRVARDVNARRGAGGGRIFMGNPRVHFQHYAGRMNEPRREQRRWRAWACWAIARGVLPELAGDSRHVVAEPSAACICGRLELLGIAGEAGLWAGALAAAKRGARVRARLGGASASHSNP